MAVLFFTLFPNGTSRNHGNNIVYQIADSSLNDTMANVVDSNNQFQLTQTRIVAFGVITAGLTFVGLVFAALQLNQMRHTQHPRTDEHETQHPRTNEYELAEFSSCKSTLLSSLVCTLR
jgi:hypothetical protein